MKNKLYSLYICAIACLICTTSCKKDDDEPTPNGSNTPPTAVIFDAAPIDGAAGVGSPVLISWLASSDAEGDAITYDVYFGTDQSNLALISSDQSSLSFTSGQLDLGTTYYFKVDAKSGVHVTSSETRTFVSSTLGSYTDSRDGHVYETLLIGNQVWMTENLVYISSGSYSYNNTSSNDAIYGRLYEWNSVSVATPAGWHLPTDDEWKTLETLLGMPAGDLNINDYGTSRGTDQGTQLKVGGSSGLDFPLAGFRSGGTYSALNERTYLWVNTDAGGGNIFRRRLVNADPSCYRFTNPASDFAISIRLVQD